MAAKKLAALQRLVFHRKFEGRRKHQQHTANCWPCNAGWVSEPIAWTMRKSLSKFSGLRASRTIADAAGMSVAQ